MSHARILKLLSVLFSEPSEPYTDDYLDIVGDMKPREFISGVCDKDRSTQDKQIFGDILTNGGCPAHLDSVDGQEHISTFMLSVGANLYADYNDNKEKDIEDIDYLYLASECGFYNAMLGYVDVLSEKLKEAELTSDKRNELLKELDEVLDRFSRLYWMAGYLEASHLHLLVADTLKEQGLLDLSATHVDKAMKDYVIAEVLHADPHTQEINKVIYDIPLEEQKWNLTSAEGFFAEKIPNDLKRAHLQEAAINELRATVKGNKELKFRK